MRKPRGRARISGRRICFRRQTVARKKSSVQGYIIKTNSNRIFIRITVGLILVLALASAVAIYFEQETQLTRIQAQSEILASELAEAKAEQAELQELQSIVDTDEYIERIARNQLGMVRPNEIVFEDD
ncbi:MAG TPA: septum formation initiator [Clostridiales bacterium]|nr:septum formation initiator [Clostridiales bacterium]